MKKIQKLSLNKSIVSSLTREETGRIRGGDDTGANCGTVWPPTACGATETCADTNDYTACDCDTNVEYHCGETWPCYSDDSVCYCTNTYCPSNVMGACY